MRAGLILRRIGITESQYAGLEAVPWDLNQETLDSFLFHREQGVTGRHAGGDAPDLAGAGAAFGAEAPQCL